MAAYFIDCDGTFFYWGTNIALPGAVQRVKKLIEDGNQVVFITRRHEEAAKPAREYVQKLFDKSVRLISQVQSPRVLMDDSEVSVIKVKTDSPWEEN